MNEMTDTYAEVKSKCEQVLIKIANIHITHGQEMQECLPLLIGGRAITLTLTDTGNNRQSHVHFIYRLHNDGRTVAETYFMKDDRINTLYVALTMMHSGQYRMN